MLTLKLVSCQEVGPQPRATPYTYSYQSQGSWFVVEGGARWYHIYRAEERDADGEKWLTDNEVSN